MSNEFYLLLGHCTFCGNLHSRASVHSVPTQSVADMVYIVANMVMLCGRYGIGPKIFILVDQPKINCCVCHCHSVVHKFTAAASTSIFLFPRMCNMTTDTDVECIVPG